ncbi:MAG: zinc ribbon domain-containing protein [Chthoniobacterales bacterium]
MKTPEICPVCDEDVPPNAAACPTCGADHYSGWRSEAAAEDAISGSGDFDYEEFVRDEFGAGAKRTAISPLWWITGLVVIAALIALFILDARF